MGGGIGEEENWREGKRKIEDKGKGGRHRDGKCCVDYRLTQSLVSEAPDTVAYFTQAPYNRSKSE